MCVSGYVGRISLGRRQVVSQRFLVPSFRRFESYRPSLRRVRFLCMEDWIVDERRLKGKRRVQLGKYAAVRGRKEGRLPAVMYDHRGVSVPLELAQQDFDRLFRALTRSTVLSLELDGGEVFCVFVKDYQHNMVSDRVEHVDFYAVEESVPLRMRIRLQLCGSPEGVRYGARLEKGLSYIEVESLPRNLPDRVVLDISGLGAGDVRRVRDVPLPASVVVLRDRKSVV